MRSKWNMALAAGILTSLCIACEEDLPDEDIPQFNRPGAVALVCYDEEDGPLPYEYCKNNTRTDAMTYAFVTQTVLGEVAVVDLDDYRIVDKESRIPFNSFVPVGGLPIDIAVTSDGRTAYTVNAETYDISIIDTARAIGTEGLEPARSLHIGGAGARILIATDSPLSADEVIDPVTDRFAFVSQPTIGRVAVINLQEYTTTNSTGDEVIVPLGVLGWLRVDAGTHAETPIVDERPGGIGPFAMVTSNNTGSLYIGGLFGGFNGSNDGNFIVEVHRNAFIDRARRSYEDNGEALPLDEADFVVRRIELGEFTTGDLDIEPDLERWMYIVENELGGILVLDLISGELLEVNRWDITADDPYSLDLPGRATRLKMLRFDETPPEGEMPGPTTFNGSFAAVATTKASMFIVDVEDNLAADLVDFTTVRHSLRYGNEWFEEVDDGVFEPVYPELIEKPRLYGDEDRISTSDRLFIDIVEREDGSVERDADTSADDDDEAPPGIEDNCEANPDGFRNGTQDGSFNVYFRCNRRLSVEQGWYLVYQGELGISGVGVMQRGEGLQDVFKDETKSFCTAGLLGPDKDNSIWNIPDDIRAGFPGVEGYRGYKGDLIEITSDPTPFDPNSDCSAFEDDDQRRIYRVAEVIDQQTLRLKALPGSGYAPLPTFECFGQAFTYTVRVGDSWVLRGDLTGLLKRGSWQGGQCVPWIGTTAEEDYPYRNCRVFEMPETEDVDDTDTDTSAAADAVSPVVFENVFLRFSLGPVPLPEDVSRDDFDALYISMGVVDAFIPMWSVIGPDISDIEIAPNDDLIFIDQSRLGLIVFDMLGEFAIRGEAIN